MRITQFPQFDFSLGVQNATTWLLKKPNELARGINLRFTDKVGGFRRRNGFLRVGSQFSSVPNSPQGAHIAKFSTGGVRFVAVNNDAGTATIIRTQNSSTGAWTTLSTISYPVNAVVFFKDYLDELYISGFDPATGDPLTPYNVDKTLSVSATRNLLNCPPCYFFEVFLGVMYAANVKIGSDRFPDRVYKSSAPLGAVTFIQGAQSGALPFFLVDSARYLKAGMSIDIYKAGTETKLYDIDITSVDKAANTIAFTNSLTASVTAANINTSTDVLTTSAAHPFTTGTPVILTSGAAPGGLATGTTYYVINVTSTTIKLATTAANATAGTAIDITSQGTGTHTLTQVITVSDNDEIWLDGRKGKLTINWNTDYPTPQTAEYLAMQPGKDASSTVSGIGTSANRLFIWTKNTGNRYDGQNLVTFNNNVGCISQRSIANIDDDWLIWMDQKGNIRARNENSGQQENISRAIKIDYTSKLTQAQLKATAAGVVDNVYKLYLGTINNQYVRVCYDFDANTWSPERLGYPALMQANDDYTGDLKPYFFSNNGYLYMDETGNKDDDKVIPFEAGTGRDMLSTPTNKLMYGLLLFSNNCKGLKIEAAVDGGQMKTIGIINEDVCFMPFPQQGDSILPEGVSLDWQIMGAVEGDAPEVDGAIAYYVPRGDVPVETR